MVMMVTEQTAIVPMQQSGFDYSQLDEATAKFAWQRAQEIRWLSDSVAQQVVEIGKKLIEVKAAVPEGCWLRWIDQEFAWNAGDANKMMRIARAFGDMSLDGVRTTYSALQLVTVSSLPSDVVTQARDRLRNGSLTTPEARDLVRPVDFDLAERYRNSRYWEQRRKKEELQIASHAAEFQAAVRNLQVCLTEVYDSIHPRVKRAVDQLTNLIAVIMDSEETEESKGPKFKIRKGGKSSQYHGVSWNSKTRRWRAVIRPLDGGRNSIHIGMFTTEEAAAHAYDAKARELYGDKARLNFPDKA